jgi:hypothetical protein
VNNQTIYNFRFLKPAKCRPTAQEDFITWPRKYSFLRQNLSETDLDLQMSPVCILHKVLHVDINGRLLTSSVL